MSVKFKVLPLLALVLALTAVTVTASTRAAPPEPILIAPAANETVNTHSPLLQWTGSDATSFKVIVKNSLGEKVLKVNADPATACTDSDCSLSPSLNGVDFLNDTFAWKVVAKNADGKTSSVKQNFTVDFPGTPTLISPTNGTSVGGTPTFTWDVVIPAEQYRIKVKNLSTKEKVTLMDWTNSGDICTDACGFTPAEGFAEGTYKWWVQARQITFPNISTSEKRTFSVVPVR